MLSFQQTDVLRSTPGTHDGDDMEDNRKDRGEKSENNELFHASPKRSRRAVSLLEQQQNLVRDLVLIVEGTTAQGHGAALG